MCEENEYCDGKIHEVCPTSSNIHADVCSSGSIVKCLSGYLLTKDTQNYNICIPCPVSSLFSTKC